VGDLSEKLYLKMVEEPVKWAIGIAGLAWKWTNLDPWQRDLMLARDRFLILNCSRQSGKSSTLMIKAVWTALTQANSLILIVAEQRQSNEDLRKCRELRRAYDKYLRIATEGRVTLPLVNESVTTIEFGNGSRIVALPGNEKVRGFSAPALVIIDEAAYLDDTVFIGIDPMLEVSQGQLVLASTPNGTNGFFYTEWNNPRYRRFQIPWHQCPRIAPESIQQKKMLYGEAYVKQEYGTEFLDEIAALFTERSLRESIENEEEVFDDEMRNITKMLEGGVELVS